MQLESINVQIGKNGLTDSLVKEIKGHLKKKQNVKVKFLKSFIEGKDRKEVAKELEAKIKKGKLIGNTYTISYK